MIYSDANFKEAELWKVLYPTETRVAAGYWPVWWMCIADPKLDDLFGDWLVKADVYCNPFQYALAADYIEENWDRLLSIAETAAGVDPEPLLRRLLERLRAEWADCLNGVGK